MRITSYFVALFLFFGLRVFPEVNINDLKNICIPKLTFYDKTVYNASNQIWCIAQDDKDFMYFANPDGLLEYDGSQWTLYKTPNNTSIVRSIAISGDKRIYMGKQNEFGYWMQNPSTRKLKYTSLSSASKLKLFDEEIWKIEILGSTIFFQSFRNIYKYNVNTGAMAIIPAPNRFQFMFRVGKRIFVQDRISGLMELKDERLEGISGGEIFTGDCIYGMTAYDRSSILIATIDRGLFMIMNNKVVPSNFPCNSFLLKNQIFCMLPLPGGKFAFGTILNGLLITDHDGKILSSINKEHGLPNNTVLSMFLDKTNNIWLGLDRGICHIQLNSSVRTFPDRKGLLGSIYQAEIFDNKLYFATNQGLSYFSLVDLSHPEKELPIHFMENSQGQIWELKVMGGKLYCAHNKGIFVVENNTGKFVYDKSGVAHFLYINDKTFLFMSYSGLFTMHINGNQYSAKAQQVFPYSGDFLVKDRNGYVYVGGRSVGFYRLKFDKDYVNIIASTNHLKEMGLDSKNMLGFYSYADNVYALEKGVGLLRLNYVTARFVPEIKINRLLNLQNDITQLQIDANEIWCYEPKRFYMIKDYLTGHPYMISRYMQPLYNEMINSSSRIKKIGEGAYLVCTSNSFAILNTNYVPKEIGNNRVYITDVGLFNKTMESLRLPYPIEHYATRNLEFPFNHKTIYVRFTLPNYQNQGNILYSYRLKGSSDNFSIPSVDNIATFTNLSAGEYELIVKATVVGANEVYYSQKVKIRILPPWYLGWMGGVLLFLFIAVLGLIYYQYLQRRWKKQQRKLMYAHEKKLAQMETRILQEKVKSQTEELTRVTNVMLYKNKLMNKLDDEIVKMNELKNINSSDLKGIKNIVEQNKNPNEEWRVFEMSFNKTHDNYLVKLSTQYPSLTPSDLKLAAYIRMNINSKEIAGLMNISTTSIEMARYRLRKKLNLTREQNLTKFLMSL